MFRITKKKTTTEIFGMTKKIVTQGTNILFRNFV